MNRQPQKHEHASTYFVGDRSSRDDQARLLLQEQMITQAMGGVLPEQPDPSRMRRVLDVGCGTGGWLIALAQAYPAIKTLCGVDISRKMVAFARAQAEAAGVSDRVDFQVMDALRRLEFPTGYFDLVNQRCGASYLRTWDWPYLLREYQRVAHIGGIIRITEGAWGAESSSPALAALFVLMRQAFYRAGHSFTEQPDGVTSALVGLCERQGWTPVQHRLIASDYQAGTPAGEVFREDMQLTFKMLVPFLHKWGHVPDDYEQQVQRALAEMQQPGFHAHGQMLLVWAHTAQHPDVFFH